MDFKRKNEFGLVENKKMIITDIHGIYIQNFRLFNKQNVKLGKHITVLSGRNGTMKTSIMGLICHIFKSEHKRDIFNKPFHTKLSDVFKLSLQKDNTRYNYDIQLKVDNEYYIQEPIKLFPNKRAERFRIVPSGNEKGDGFFELPNRYLNLKRLYPLVEIEDLKKSNNVEYTEEEKDFIAEFYESVLLKDSFGQFNTYTANFGTKGKNTIGPSNSFYDIDSISSGEDNLGTIANTLVSFNRLFETKKNVNELTGILSIDEFEASLHPIAQFNLLKFLYSWSKEKQVKILLTTHSLSLLQNIYKKFENQLAHEDIIINFLATDYFPENQIAILKNPKFSLAIQELTLSPEEKSDNDLKVKILCEDDVAEHAIKRIISNNTVIQRCKFVKSMSNDNNGISYTTLIKLSKSYPVLLKETNSVVIVDGDIPLPPNTRYDKILSIPTINDSNLPIEKEIVKYILTLNNDDIFFRNFKKTKEMFKKDFKEFGIPLNVEIYKNHNIACFKNWYSKNKRDAQKYVNKMIKNEPTTYETFKIQFIRYVNKILEENGLPIINI
ncbi:AAA family ATPase [Staphylococcus xylosus]|uniref:AAA family ATPase n=1 Tax=Staphylococcus xylosus TaxID=1288 RepID=UPI003F56CCE2